MKSKIPTKEEILADEKQDLIVLKNRLVRRGCHDSVDGN